MKEKKKDPDDTINELFYQTHKIHPESQKTYFFCFVLLVEQYSL